jgi:hypothetical protein
LSTPCRILSLGDIYLGSSRRNWQHC